MYNIEISKSPVFAVLFSKSAAKVRIFPHTAKQNAQKRPLCAQFRLFVQSPTVPLFLLKSLEVQKLLLSLQSPFHTVEVEILRQMAGCILMEKRLSDALSLADRISQIQSSSKNKATVDAYQGVIYCSRPKRDKG